MATAKPMNTIPNTLAVISAECSLSIGSKKWDCNAPPRSPRMLKPMPAVASATTLRTKSFVLLYPACPFELAVALMQEADGILGGKLRQLDDGAALERGLMSAQTDASPVGRLLRVRERVAILRQCHHEFMHQVRMRSAVARPLGEAQVRLLRQIIDPFHRESPDRLRQPLRVVRHLDLLRNLRLRQLRRVQHVRLVLGQRP